MIYYLSGATTKNPNGGVGLWLLDPSTGITTKVNGVTDVAKSYEEVDVNFAGDVTYLMVDMYHHSFAEINISAESAGTIELFNVSLPAGSLPGDVNVQPHWLGAASSDSMVGWSRFEEMGGPTIVITETLLGIQGKSTSTILYQNQTTIAYNQTLPPAIYGTTRAISAGVGGNGGNGAASSILHTYADGVLKDWSPTTGKLLQEAAVSSLPAEFDISCLFYNEAAGALAGLAFSTASSTAAAARVAEGAQDPYYITLDCSGVNCTATAVPLTGLAQKTAGLSWLPKTCSYSKRTGTVAVLLTKSDPNALPAFAIEEVAVFGMHVPVTVVSSSSSSSSVEGTPNFWVAPSIQFTFGDAGVGRKWRPVGFPFMSYNTGSI